MDVLHAFIADKTTSWQILIDTCNLTPRIEQEMQSTIRFYQETAKRQYLDLVESRQTLLALSDAIEDHWRQIYGSPSKAACLQKHLHLFREFLRSKLLEDYVGTPCSVNKEIVRLGRSKGGMDDRERAAREFGAEVDDADDAYQQRGIYVLDELMLDRAYVESKMRAAAARDGQPGSDVQPLIDRCDWRSLAAVLQKDQLLIMQLFEEGADKEKKVQRGLSKIRKKYFRELNSESSFVLSKYASKIEVKYQAKLGVAESTSSYPHGAPHTYSDPSEEDGIFS